MDQSQQRSTLRAEGRDGSDRRVVEFELGEFGGMQMSLTVRPRDAATDLGAVARLADELRMRLGKADGLQDTSTPNAKPPQGDVGAVYRSWAHPDDGR